MVLPFEVLGVFSKERTWKLPGFPVVLVVKNPPADQAVPKRRGFDHWVGKILWRRKWQPTPVFLLGNSHRQRSLVGYSPWGHKNLDMTE